MPLKKFKDELNSQKASRGDRVVINGGEPTIHPEFFNMLGEAYKRECFLDLYTNGQKLSDPEFVNRLMEFTPILVRIPIFGATEEKHDFLTGKKGNFNKLMNTFRYLGKFDESKEDVYIEVKLLLSKATIDENLAIIKLFEKQFPGLFYFSLNPLISSEKVIQNKKLLVWPLEKLVDDSIPLIEYTLEKDIQLDINLIPFCLVPEKYRHLIHLPDRNVLEEHYSDPINKDAHNNKFESKKCSECLYHSGCKGFPPHYFHIFSDKVVEPFAEPFKVI